MIRNSHRTAILKTVEVSNSCAQIYFLGRPIWWWFWFWSDGRWRRPGSTWRNDRSSKGENSIWKNRTSRSHEKTMGNWKGNLPYTFIKSSNIYRKFVKEQNKRDKKLLKIQIQTPMMQIIGLSLVYCCPIGNPTYSVCYWRATQGGNVWTKIRKLIHLTGWKRKESEKKQKDKKELL